MSRYFVNPFGSSFGSPAIPAISAIPPSIPPHVAGIVPIINPTGPPTLVAFGHNGIVPLSHQIHQAPQVHHAHHAHHVPSHSKYDYVGVLVLTRSRRSLGIEILLPVGHGSVHLDVRRVRSGDDYDFLLNRMLDDYGLSYFGKHTTIRHVEHSNGCKYKFCIVYAHEISRTKINTKRSSRSYHTPLQRFVLPPHKIGSVLVDNYGSAKSVDFETSNIIYAISNMTSAFTY